MNVIIINEDNHGTIGIAKNMERAVQFLLDTDWLDEKFVIIENDGKELYIKEHLGEDWCELVRNMSVEEFNKYFEGSFCLYVEQVY